MSQRKPGARDISDLKARLGLKKKGPAKSDSGGGVVAPPGAAARPSSVPAPPGAQAPQPEIPDASQDPFGAMNAMAAHQATARGPEIVVVNDGGPVESVEQQSAGLKYAKIAGIILFPLIVGVAVGQISSSAKRSNEVIEDAGKIQVDLKKLNNGLVDLNDVLLDAKTRGPGGKGYKVNDKALTKELAAFDFPKVDNSVVYGSAMYEMPIEVVENLLYYYQEMRQLQEMINEHVTKSQQDAKAIDDAGERLSKKLSRGSFTFGALIKMPSEDEAEKGLPPKIRVVELGAPVCQDGKPGQCEGAPKGFTVREDAKDLAWASKAFPQVSGNAVGSDGLLLLEPTPVFTDAIAGADASLAQTFYQQRINAIDEKVEELVDIGNKLVGQLKAKASESEKFTFFM